jgi:hypothetical protein
MVSYFYFGILFSKSLILQFKKLYKGFICGNNTDFSVVLRTRVLGLGTGILYDVVAMCAM